MSKQFDAYLRNQLANTEEVEIETQRGKDAPAHHTTIWVTVNGEDVYVRSVRGPAGRWYREITAHPVGALHVAGQRVPVHAVPANDEASIARENDALTQKYHDSPSLPSMLRDQTLPTTLRLEPL